MTCYACDNEPSQQCARCGRPYCEKHGEDFCDICLQPSSGVPSFTLYRGSLLALLVGTAIAVWLLVQPSGGRSESASRPIVVTATAPAAAARPLTTGTAGPQPTTGAGTPQPTSSAGAASSSRTPSAGGTGTYTVQSGDTLSAICSNNKPASMTVGDCVDQIKSLNGLTSDDLDVGQKLKVPQ